MENLGLLPDSAGSHPESKHHGEVFYTDYTIHKLHQVMSQRTHIGTLRESASTIPLTACTELRTFKDPMVSSGPISAHAVSRPPPIFTYPVPLFSAWSCTLLETTSHIHGNTLTEDPKQESSTQDPRTHIVQPRVFTMDVYLNNSIFYQLSCDDDACPG